jgi:hypothetical protein
VFWIPERHSELIHFFVNLQSTSFDIFYFFSLTQVHSLVTWAGIQGYHHPGSICLHAHNTNSSIDRASETLLI